MAAVGGTSAKEEEEQLLVKKHIKYLQRVLGVLPYGAKSMDVNRYKLNRYKLAVFYAANLYLIVYLYFTHAPLFPPGPHPLPLPFLFPLGPHPLLRMTLLFFGVCGLDILNSLDAIRPYERDQIIEWIYAQQILPYRSGVY